MCNWIILHSRCPLPNTSECCYGFGCLLELMVRPTLMNCGHMYCYRCLESNFAHNSSCSLCRQQQNPDHFIHSALAQNLINEYLIFYAEFLCLDRMNYSNTYAALLIHQSGVLGEKLRTRGLVSLSIFRMLLRSGEEQLFSDFLTSFPFVVCL